MIVVFNREQVKLRHFCADTKTNITVKNTENIENYF